MGNLVPLKIPLTSVFAVSAIEPGSDHHPAALTVCLDDSLSQYPVPDKPYFFNQ
jgi:hypothetical protein